MPRAKLRTAELRNHVVDVAVSLLAEQGVAALTTRRVACRAATSIPAVYELFGDKAGLVRELFFEGFRVLRRRLDECDTSDDPLDDIRDVALVYRAFVQDYPALAEVMFSRPFADFDPGADELEAGRAVREFIVQRVRACVDRRLLAGDPTDIAHVLLALAQGLAAQEAAGLLGTSRASRDRRWRLAFDAVLDGFSV